MIPASLFHPREADIIKGIDIASTLEPVETHLCGTSVTKQKKKLLLKPFLGLFFYIKVYVVKMCLIFDGSSLAFGASYQSFLRVY